MFSTTSRKFTPAQLQNSSAPSSRQTTRSAKFIEPSFRGSRFVPDRATCWSSARADAALEFGRFRVLLRRRRLLADGIPVALGARAFDLLLVLLEADGALVTKEELLNRVWQGSVVSEDNLKLQVCALRKALGADRELIRTEFGRGYRFTGILRLNATAPICRGPSPSKLRSVGACFRRAESNRYGVVPVRASSRNWHQW